MKLKLFFPFPVAPSIAPANVRGFAPDHSSISLEWDAPPVFLLNGILTAYIVNVTERETGNIFVRNTTTPSILLDSLHPHYVYECRVAAYTVEAGPFSTVFAVQVLMAGKENTLDNLIVELSLLYCHMICTCSSIRQS